MSIVDELCRDLGDYRTPAIPEDTGEPGWTKHFVCLYCGDDGKKTAAINYGINYYKCFRCGHDVSAGRYHEKALIGRKWIDRILPAGTDPVSRYRAQINQAARTIAAKLPYSVSEWEAREYARDRVLAYAGAPDVKDADAGQLAVWEDKADFDFNEVDRYVLHALNRDLLNWGDKRILKARRERTISLNEPIDAGDDPRELQDIVAGVEDKGFAEVELLDGHPYLRAVHRDGMTVDEIAELLNVTPRTVLRRLAEERETLRADTAA